MNIREKIIEIALENGASVAGIASVEAVRSSPSHRIYPHMADYSGIGTVTDDDTIARDELFDWPKTAKSIVVIGLSHPKNKPELDWWDGKGGTPGNRALMGIAKRTRDHIEQALGIKTQKLHYYVEKGGVFLKDAAALAGLGCIGKSNLFITPEFGPRIRLRALFLNSGLEPTGPVDFDPCTDCDLLCRNVCPEKAMDRRAPAFSSLQPASAEEPSREHTSPLSGTSSSRPINDHTDAGEGLPARDGTYDRVLCNSRMEKDIAECEESSNSGDEPVKYCRKCEFVCPAGKDR
jgi:epoxyqueuosine reductase